jgi:hypothetical protein
MVFGRGDGYVARPYQRNQTHPTTHDAKDASDKPLTDMDHFPIFFVE